MNGKLWSWTSCIHLPDKLTSVFPFWMWKLELLQYTAAAALHHRQSVSQWPLCLVFIACWAAGHIKKLLWRGCSRERRKWWSPTKGNREIRGNCAQNYCWEAFDNWNYQKKTKTLLVSPEKPIKTSKSINKLKRQHFLPSNSHRFLITEEHIDTKFVNMKVKCWRL